MSCGDGEFVYTQERTLDDFKEYRDGAFEVNGDEVIKNLANMAAADQGGLSADKFTRNYYKEKGVLKTINADGSIEEVWERLLNVVNN